MKEKIISSLKWFYKSFIWLFVVLFVVDIITKQVIMNSGVEAPGLVADWGFVHISYVQNPNAAFGLGADNPLVSRIVYLIVASLVSVGLIVYMILKRKEMKPFIRACLVLVVTGAFGNMIDRIFYAQTNYCVVDWIDFWWFWPFVFNIADCCIVIAAFMLIIYIIVSEVKEMIAKRNAEVAMQKDVKQDEKSEENSEEDKSK